MARYVIDNRPVPLTFDVGDDDTARTIMNAKNIIMTVRGEIPYNRLCGIDADIFDMPINEVNDVLMEAVDEALEFEPDAEAVDAKAWLDANGETVIEVTIDVTENEEEY